MQPQPDAFQPSPQDLDLDLLEFLHSLTPAERMRRHESALALVRALRQAGARLHGDDLGGFQCKVMGVQDLIQAKRTLGRPKDLRVVVELEAVGKKE